MSNSNNQKEIIRNQYKILKCLKNARDEFRRVDSLFYSCQAMLNSIPHRLNDVEKKINDIESLINGCMSADGIKSSLEIICKKLQSIGERQKKITINTNSDDIEQKVEKIIERVKAIIKQNDADPTYCTTSKVRDITCKLDAIICKLGSIETTIDCFASQIGNVPVLKNIECSLNNIECSLNNIGECDIIGKLIQLKNNFFCRTEIITTVLILGITILTSLPFLLLQDKNSDCRNIVCKDMVDPYVPLGSILIILALAGIWAIAFMYLKSRLKIDEQDSTVFRKSLADDC